MLHLTNAFYDLEQISLKFGETHLVISINKFCKCLKTHFVSCKAAIEVSEMLHLADILHLHFLFLTLRIMIQFAWVDPPFPNVCGAKIWL